MAFGRRSTKPKAFLDAGGLYEFAVKALGRHMRSEADLRRLMKPRVEPGETGEAAIAAVVEKLKESRYLDDQSYAETYARLRQQNDKLGSRRVGQDLARKGIRSGLIAETVAAGYAGTDEEALARQHLERKRIRKPENEKETARVMRRLVAAGFSAGVIYKILRAWDMPDEALAGVDQLDQLGEEAPTE